MNETTNEPSRLRTTLVARLVVLLAAVLPLLPALSNGFSFDDSVLIVDSQATWKDRLLDDFFGRESDGAAASGYWRPVTALSYGLEKRLYGDSATGYHATNVAIHAGNSLLLHELLIGIGAVQPLAFGAALVFAAHPIHAESLAPITGRTDPLALLFVLLATWALRRQRYLLATCAFVLALGAKESALALVPFLALATREVDPVRGRRLALWVLLSGLVLGAAYFAIKIELLDIVRPQHAFSGEGTLGQRVLTFVALVPRYLGLLVWPADLSVAHPVRLVTSVGDPALLVGLGLIVVLLALISSRSVPLALGAAAFAIPLLPASNVIPITYAFRWMPFPFFERYLYVPSIGFSILASFALWQIARRVRVANVAATHGAISIVIAALLGARLVERLPVFRSDESYFLDASRASASSLEPRIQAAVQRFLAGDLRGAIAMFEAIRAESPKQAESEVFVLEYATVRAAYAQRLLEAAAILRSRQDEAQAKLYSGEGYRRIDETRADLEAFRKRMPRSGRALELLAVLSGIDGDPYAAARSFRDAADLPGTTSEYARNFERVATQLLERGRAEAGAPNGGSAAIETYKRGIEAICGEYPPQRTPAAVRDLVLKMWCDLADQLVLIGHAEEASAAYRAVLEREPRLARCYEGLAYLTNAGGNVEATLDHLKRALEIEPEAYVALNLMVATLKRERRDVEAAAYEQRLIAVMRKGGNQAPRKPAGASSDGR